MSTRSRRIASGTHVEIIWSGGIAGDVSLLYGGSPCAELTVGNDGTLVVLDAAGQTVSLTVTAGQVLRCQFVTAVAAGSVGCSPLTAVW